MNIALIAQNRKKELMVQFCIAYCGALSQHELCSTGSTGKLISEATGLKVTCLLPGVSGGDEQIAARAAYNELEQTTAQYYDKLVELGVIVPPKSQEELMAEMQRAMLEMSGIISSLSGEIRELKENGAKQCACSCGEDVSKREPKRGGTKGAGSDQRDGGQP